MVLKIIKKVKNRFLHYYYKNKKFSSEQEFYTYFFTKDPSWSSPVPNEDESIRLKELVNVIDSLNINQPIEVLEVGCGRGWLCNELSKYGVVVGIEPVQAVVEYAKKIFPKIEFHAAFLDGFIGKFPARKFDLIVSTEVLEHVNDKSNFLKLMKSVLKPNGTIIITTPRLEIYDAFVTQYGVEPGQPVEEWLSEEQAEKLIKDEGFVIHSHKCFGPLISNGKADFTTQLLAFKKE